MSTEDVSPPSFSERNSGYYERSSRLVAETDSYLRRQNNSVSSNSNNNSSGSSNNISYQSTSTSSSSSVGGAAAGDNRGRARDRLYRNGPYTAAATTPISDRSTSSSTNSRVPPSWYDASATITNSPGGSGNVGASIAGSNMVNNSPSFAATISHSSSPASTVSSPAAHRSSIYGNVASAVVQPPPPQLDISTTLTATHVGAALNDGSSIHGAMPLLNKSSKLNKLIKSSRAGSESPTTALSSAMLSVIATATSTATTTANCSSSNNNNINSSSSSSTINSSNNNFSSSSNATATTTLLTSSSSNGGILNAAAALAAAATSSSNHLEREGGNTTNHQQHHSTTTSSIPSISSSNTTTSHRASRAHLHGRSTTSSSRSRSRSPSSYSSSHSSSSSSSNSHASSPVSGSEAAPSGRVSRMLQSAVTAPTQGNSSNPSGNNGGGSCSSSSSSTGGTNPVVHSEDNRPLAIRVRNLPARSSDTSLKDGLFHEYKKHGKVTWVKVVGQNSERYALVCFKKPDDVEKALEVSHDKLFFGCKIEVEPYQGYDVEDNEFRPYEAELDEYHPKSTRTLFIGNLEKEITSSELRGHFECFGEIIEIDIKKQGMNAYAFCQYSDIVSVVKAMRKMDGEHLGSNRIKLGFGKSMPTNCVWIDGVGEKISESHLQSQFSRYGTVTKVIADRTRQLALVLFDQIQYAQTAVKEMRGATLRGRKLQVDFASRECQDAFYEKLEKQTAGSRFNRYDSQSRSRASSFSRHQNSNDGCSPSNTPGSSSSSGSGITIAPTLSSAIVAGSSAASTSSNCSSASGAGVASVNCILASVVAQSSTPMPGSTTPARSHGSRSSRHTMDYDYMDTRRFRSYDEYSQGSTASHDEECGAGPHSSYSTSIGLRSDSPLLSRLGPIVGSAGTASNAGNETLEVTVNTSNNASIGRRRGEKSPAKQKGDIRILQKERSHLLEQLEECPSSGDESIVSPRKRIKIDHHHLHSSSGSIQSHLLESPATTSTTLSHSGSVDHHNNLNSSNCDVILHDPLLHRKSEVRRLSECNTLKFQLQQQQHLQHHLQQQQQQQSRRPSIDITATAAAAANCATLGSSSVSHRHARTCSTGSNSDHQSQQLHAPLLSSSAMACKRRRVAGVGGSNSGAGGGSGAVASTTSAAQPHGINTTMTANDEYHHHASRGRGHQLHSHHSHEASGAESADGSRPGTPLCDERPEVLPSEPRRLRPRERPHEPMVLPLPKFGIQFFQQYRNSVTAAAAAGSSTSASTFLNCNNNISVINTSSSSTSCTIGGNAGSHVLLSGSSNNATSSVGVSSSNLCHSSLSHNSTTSAATSSSSHLPSPSARYTPQWRPHHHHHHHHHNAQSASGPSTASPLRPRSLSSNSSDSDVAPNQSGSPSLEERIRTLDEMYERWSGGGSNTNAAANVVKRHDFTQHAVSWQSLPPRTVGDHSSSHHSTSNAGNQSVMPSAATRHHKFIGIDVKELKPSDIVKSVLAKKSIFDDDLQRLKNINDKYEPAVDSSQLSKTLIGACTTPALPNLAATKTPVVGSLNKPTTGVLLQRLSSLSPMNSPQASISPYNSPSPSPSVGLSTASLVPLSKFPTPPVGVGSVVSPIANVLSSSVSTAATAAAIASATAANKGLQYPFPSHPPLPNTAAPVAMAQPAPPTGPAPADLQPKATAPPLPPETPPQTAAGNTSKPKTIVMTKSLSVPANKTTTAACNDGEKNASRVLTKSASVPGSTNVGTVKMSSNASVDHSAISGNSSSSSKQDEETTLPKPTKSSSTTSSASSKKNEKSHKHNHHRVDVEKKSTKSEKSSEKRKNSSALSLQSIASTPRREDESSDSEVKEQEHTERERRERSSDKIDKEKHSREKRDREKELKKQQQEREESERKEKEERERKEREERERIQKEEKERKQREDRERKQRLQEIERREREERERKENEERERREKEESERREKVERERKDKEEHERKEKEERERKEREEKERKERERQEKDSALEREHKSQNEREEPDRYEKRRNNLSERKSKDEQQQQFLRDQQRRKVDTCNSNVLPDSSVFPLTNRAVELIRHTGDVGDKENATDQAASAMTANTEVPNKTRSRKPSRNSPIRIPKRRLSSQDSSNGTGGSVVSGSQNNDDHTKRMRIDSQTSSCNQQTSSAKLHERQDSKEAHVKENSTNQRTKHHHQRQHSNQSASSQKGQSNSTENQQEEKVKVKEHNSKHKNKHHAKHSTTVSSSVQSNECEVILQSHDPPVEEKRNCSENITEENRNINHHEEISEHENSPTSRKQPNSTDDEDDVQQPTANKTPTTTQKHREHGSGHHSRHRREKREHREKKRHAANVELMQAATLSTQNNLTDEEHALHNPNRRASGAGSSASGEALSLRLKLDSGHRSVERKSSRCSDEGLLSMGVRPSNNPKATPSRKMLLSSADSDDSEDTAAAKKHSIFDIPDEGPYVSMYDKVKARSCKNMQKQEEEKKIKAKFSQLKQSRAKREEKKRSTSYDGDTDSDYDERSNQRSGGSGSGNRNHGAGGLSSTDDDDTNPAIERRRRGSHQSVAHPQRMFSDSDSAEAEARRTKIHNNLLRLCDGDESSDEEIRPNVRRILSPSKRITSKRNSHTTPRIASDSESQSAADVKIKQEVNDIETVPIESNFNTQQIKKEHLQQHDSDSVDIKYKRRSSISSADEHRLLCFKTEQVPKLAENEIKKELKDFFGGSEDVGYALNAPEQETPKATTHANFSPEGRKKHKKSKKRQKAPSILTLGMDITSTTLAANVLFATDTTASQALPSKCNSVQTNSPTFDPFDELKREATLTTTPQINNGATEAVTSDKKRHKERKEKKRDKLRNLSDGSGSVDFDKTTHALTKEERHRLRKSKKSKSLDTFKITPNANAAISTPSEVYLAQPHAHKRSGEKMEDIFGPISEEEDESQYSDKDSLSTKESSLNTPSHNTTVNSTSITGPIVSAALNPYKQEPLTPKSHTVEENEENKLKVNSSHIERERHRKEKREKKRKEREKSREQHALATLQQPKQALDDENSVDLDEAGRALEAQLMEDSDNKQNEDNTPSTAKTYRSDMTDVFRFSDADENSLDVAQNSTAAVSAQQEPQDVCEKQQLTQPPAQQQHNKCKEKKKKKKRSKEERHHHQRRESSSSTASQHQTQQQSFMSPPTPAPAGKLTIDMQVIVKHSQKLAKQEGIDEDDGISAMPMCKPSPSLPCLLGDDDDLQAPKATIMTPLAVNSFLNKSADLLSSLTSPTRDKKLISPIPKTPTIINTSSGVEKPPPTTPVTHHVPASSDIATTPTSSTSATAAANSKSTDSRVSMTSPVTSTSATKKKSDKFIPGFDGELDERISESAVQSISAEFNSPILDPTTDEPKIPIASPPDASKHIDKIDDTKSRVTISQEETESAVSALLGESFGTSSNADYNFNDDGLDDLTNADTQSTVMVPEADEEAAIAAQAIETEPRIEPMTQPEQDAEEMLKAVQSLNNVDMDIKVDTPQSVQDLQIDTDTEENADEADSSGNSLKIDETALSTSPERSAKTETITCTPEEVPDLGKEQPKHSVIIKADRETTQKLTTELLPPRAASSPKPLPISTKSDAKISNKEKSLTVSPMTSVLPSMMNLDSTGVSTEITETPVRLNFTSTPVKSAAAQSIPDCAPATPTTKHVPALKPPPTLATNAFLMQPPTISIPPETAAHFIVPQMVHSPSASNRNELQSLMLSPHQQQLPQIPTPNAVGPSSTYISVRAPSPHSPHLQQQQASSRGSTPTRQHSPANTIATLSPTTQQQHVLLNSAGAPLQSQMPTTLGQRQQMHMSSPCAAAGNNQPLSLPTSSAIYQRANAQTSPSDNPSQHSPQLHIENSGNKINSNYSNASNVVPNVRNSPTAVRSVIEQYPGQHKLPIAVQKMPPVPTHPTIISKVVSVPAQQAQQQHTSPPISQQQQHKMFASSSQTQQALGQRHSPQILQQISKISAHQQHQQQQYMQQQHILQQQRQQIQQQQQQHRQQHHQQMQQQILHQHQQQMMHVQKVHQQQHHPQQQQHTTQQHPPHQQQPNSQQNSQPQHSQQQHSQQQHPQQQHSQQQHLQQQHSQQQHPQHQSSQQQHPQQQHAQQQPKNPSYHLQQQFHQQQPRMQAMVQQTQQQQQTAAPQQSTPNKVLNTLPATSHQNLVAHRQQQTSAATSTISFQQSTASQKLVVQQHIVGIPQSAQQTQSFTATTSSKQQHSPVLAQNNQQASTALQPAHHQPTAQQQPTSATNLKPAEDHSKVDDLTASNKKDRSDDSLEKSINKKDDTPSEVISQKLSENVSVIRTPTPTTGLASNSAPKEIAVTTKASLLTEENVIKISPPKEDENEQDSKEDSDYWSAKEVNIDSVIKKVDAICGKDEKDLQQKPHIDPINQSQTVVPVSAQKTGSASISEAVDLDMLPEVHKADTSATSVASATDHDTEDETETHTIKNPQATDQPQQQSVVVASIPTLGKSMNVRGGTVNKRGRQPRGGKKQAAANFIPATTPGTINPVDQSGVQTRLRKPTTASTATRGRKGRPPTRHIAAQQQLLQQLQQQQQQQHQIQAISTATVPGTERKARNQAAAAPSNAMPPTTSTSSDQDIYEFHDDSGGEDSQAKQAKAAVANTADTRPRLILTIKSPGQATPIVMASEKTVDPSTTKTLSSPIEQKKESETTIVAQPSLILEQEQQLTDNTNSLQQLLVQQSDSVQVPTEQTLKPAAGTAIIDQQSQQLSDLTLLSSGLAAANTRKSRRLQEKDRNTIDDTIEDVVRNTQTNAALGAGVTNPLPKGAETPPRRSGRNAAHPKRPEPTTTAASNIPNAVGRPRRSKDRKSSAEHIQPSDYVDLDKITANDNSMASSQTDEDNHSTSTEESPAAIQAATTAQVQPATAPATIPQHPKKKALAAAEIESHSTSSTSSPKSALPSTGLPVLNSAAPASTQKTTGGGAADVVSKSLVDPVTGMISSMQQGKEGSLPAATASGAHPKPLDPKKIMQAAVASGLTNSSIVNDATQTQDSFGSKTQQLPQQTAVQPPAPTTPITAPTKPVQVETAAAAITKAAALASNKAVSVVVKTSPTAPSIVQQQLKQQQSTPIKQQILVQQSQPTMHAQHTNVRPPTLKAHVLNSQKSFSQQQTMPQQQQQTMTPQHQLPTQQQFIHQQQQQIIVSNASHVIQSNIVARNTVQQQQLPLPTSNVQQHQQQLLVNIPPTHSPHNSAVQSPRLPPQQQQQSLVIKQGQQQPTSQQQVLHVVNSKSSIVTQTAATSHMTMQQHATHANKQQHQHPQFVSNSQQQLQMPTQLLLQQQHLNANANAVKTGPQATQTIPSHKHQQHNVVKQQQLPHGVSVVTHQQIGKQQTQQHLALSAQQQQHLKQQQPASLGIPAAGLLGMPPHPVPAHQIAANLLQSKQTPPTHLQTQQHHTPSPPLQQQQHMTAKQNPLVHNLQQQNTLVMSGVGVGSPPPTTLKQQQQQQHNLTCNIQQPQQQSVATGAGGLRTTIPTISPQGQARSAPLLLQPGLAVPPFEANIGETSFPPGPIRGVTRDHIIMYQQYLRSQESLAAAPRLPYKDVVGGELDESLAGSPPLELRRPGSVPRTIAVPHSLQSPQDRATDSPQVAQVYVHNTRIPHPHYPEVAGRFFDVGRQLTPIVEPPPAHRSVTAHSVVAPPSVVVPPPGGSGASAFIGSTSVQPPPPPTAATVASNLAHLHPKMLEREREQQLQQREREREREHEQQLQREQMLKERIGMSTASAAAATTSSTGAITPHDNLGPSLSTTVARHMQVATPPHATSQVPPPPQADSLLTLLQRYPVMWQGLLALKTDQAAVQMHFVFGNPHVARASLPCNSDGSTPPLRIAQRMRLEQTQLEGVAKKMQFENEHCMLLALPCGRDHADVLQQSRNLQTGFITYLQQKMAAGIVNIPVPGSEQAAYVVHIFPSCDFANENLERAAPDLKNRVAEIAHLLIVIATV